MVERNSELIERILSEGAIGIPELCRRYGAAGGKGGRPLHSTTVTRWATKGVKAVDGRTVRLETICLGGKRMTCKAAFVRFIAAMETAEGEPEVEAIPARRRKPSKRSEAASRRLDELGIGTAA